MSASFFALASLTIYLAGAIPYAIHILQGKVTPHPFTWGIGLILMTINVYGLYFSGADWSLVPAIIRICFILFGTIAGIIYIRKISIGWFDYLCLLFACSCGTILYYYGLSEAILASIVVSAVAASPTIKKIWLNPNSEDALMWIAIFLAQLLMLLSIEHHTFDNSIFWIYAALENGIIALLVMMRTRHLQDEKNRWSIRKAIQRIYNLGCNIIK